VVTLAVGITGGSLENALLVSAVQGIALAAAFYCDHVQSLVLANLIGMITPLYTSESINARVSAVGSFSLFKVAIYTLTLFINFLLLPAILYRTDTLFGGVVIALLQLFAFYGLQEWVIAQLWHRFLQPRGERLFVR
jgi:hypothetical protein